MAQALLPDSVFDSAQSASAAPQVLPDSVFQPQSASANAPVPQQGFLSRLGQNLMRSAHAANQVSGDLFGGLLSGLQGIGNAPWSIAHVFNKNINPSPVNYDWASSFGGGQSTPDKFVQGMGSFIPFALGGEAALPADAGLLMKGANLAGTGAAYGLTQSPNNPFSGAVYSSLGNLAGGTLAGGAGLAGSALKNYLSKFAVKGITNALDDSMVNIKNLTNAQAFDLTRNNYENYSSAEKKAWDNLTAEGAIADENGANFDNSKYVSSLNNQLDVLKSQSGRQTPFARANSDSQQLLNGYINDEHGTFTDAIEHNKALNQDYQNEITPGKSLPFDTVNFAKKQINQTISDNLNANGLQDTLGSAWNDANAATQQKNQIFNTVVSPKGREQFSTFSQLLKSNNPYQDASTFVNEYVPTSRGEGTQKMQQFAQMLGDEDQAKNIIKMNYFDSTFNGTGDAVNPQQFLNKYNNLSNEQQNYLFNPYEQKTLNALNQVVSKSPQVLKSSSGLGQSVLPILGAIGGHMSGPGAILGGAAGWAANKGLNAGLDYVLSSKPMTNYFINQLGAPQAQGSINLMPYLIQGMGATAATQAGSQR